MSGGAELSGLTRALERALGAVAEAAFRRPLATLALVGVLSAFGVLQARKLQVDTDLVALLPDTFPSVQGLEEVRKRYGGVGNVAVIAHGAEPEVLRRFADDIAPELEKLETIDYVDFKRPDDFFRDRALYFLEIDDLEDVKERIQERIDYEKRGANPLLVDLEDTGPPELDFSDLEKKYGREELVAEGKKDPYYLSAERKMLVVIAKPHGFASNFSLVEKVVDDVESVVEKFDPAKYDPNLKVELSGRFKKRIDQQRSIQSDLRITSIVALLLVIVYVVFHFRRVGAILLIVLPLTIGLSWTFGLAALAFGSLNILTAFVGAILLGLGIDHGIHFLERFESERADGKTREEAIRATFANTGRAVVLAGLTTAVGFAGLAISDFRAFREFGVIAGAGVVFVVIAYVLCLPPFLRLASAIARPRSGEVGAWFGAFGKGVAGWSPAIFWAVTVVAVLVAVQIRNVQFDYDFNSLEDAGNLRSYELDEIVNEVLGRQQVPVVLLTDHESDEAGLADLLRKRKDSAGDASTISIVVSPSDLVPSDQEEKREILDELAEDLESVVPEDLPEKDRGRFEMLKRMVATEPFGRKDLPEEVQRQFRLKRQGDGGMVLVYPSVRLSDGQAILRLAKELRNVPLAGGGHASAAGEAMVLADVLTMIFTESPVVVAATLILVFFTLWLLLGRVKMAILCYLPALLSVLTMVGAVHLAGMKLNYLNIVLVPVLFGIAVDAGVHLVVRGAYSHDHLIQAVRDTGRAIWGAALTTAAGFGALLLAHHPGLHSFGKTALLGLVANLVAALLWLTALLALRHVRRGRLELSGLGGSFANRTWGDLGTVWGAGYSPKAPGTFGAVAAIPVGWLLSQADLLVRVGLVAGLVCFSILVAYRYVAGGTKDLDPQEVVFDELVGVLIAFTVIPWEWPWVVSAFLLFRLFDIVKPGPVGWIDRKMKNPAGIMLDDVVAGLLAAAVLVGARFLFGV